VNTNSLNEIIQFYLNNVTAATMPGKIHTIAQLWNATIINNSKSALLKSHN